MVDLYTFGKHFAFSAKFRQGVYQLVEYGPAVGLGTRVFAPVSDFTQMDCRVLHVTYPVSRPVSFTRCQVQ